MLRRERPVVLIASLALVLLFGVNWIRYASPASPCPSPSPLPRHLDDSSKIVAKLKDRLKRSKTREQKLRDHLEELERSEVTSSPPPADVLPYLIIPIPTVPRKNKDYLTKVLKSFADQIDNTRWAAPGGIKVVVMNMRAHEHHHFEDLRDEHSERSWMEFVEVADDEKYVVERDGGFPKVHPARNQERPNAKVKRQTLDVSYLLQSIASRSKYVMLYEDDFLLCENTLMALEYMIEKALRYSKGFAGIRCSFGLAGVVLQNSAPYSDVEAFAKYLKRHYGRRPPDHLVVEWYAKEIDEAKEYFGKDRPVMAFRHNVLHHIGTQSTLREAKPWAFPGCFEELIAPQIFEVEAWDPKQCPHSDMWPCDKSQSSLKWKE